MTRPTFPAELRAFLERADVRTALRELLAIAEADEAREEAFLREAVAMPDLTLEEYMRVDKLSTRAARIEKAARAIIDNREPSETFRRVGEVRVTLSFVEDRLLDALAEALGEKS